MDTLLDLAWKNAVLVTVLAFLVAGVAFFCRRWPALVHTLWLLVLIKFLIPSFYPVEVPGLNLPEVSLPETVGTTIGQKSPAVSTPNDLSTGFAKNFASEDGADASPPVSQGTPAVLPLPPDQPQLSNQSARVGGAESSKLRSSELSRGFEESAPATQGEAGGAEVGSKEPQEPPLAIGASEGASDIVPATAGAEVSLEVLSSDIPETAPAWAPAFSWKIAILAIWSTGSLAWLAIAGIRIIRFQRFLHYAKPAGGSVAELAQVWADRLGLRRCPKILFIPAPVSPMLWALGFRARLVIPTALWDRLAEEQRQTLLIHELAHLRRRDHWVRRLEMLATALFWWHPVLWWAERQLRRAEEECCDAWVVWALPAAGQTYATALVETLAFLSNVGPALPLGASGIEHIHHLKRRLAMIMNGTSPRAMSRAGFWIVLGLGMVLLPLLPISAQPQVGGGDEEDQKLDPPQPEKPAGLPSRRQPPGLTPLPQDRQEQLEAARDEVELLQAQLAIKRAEIGEAETQIKSSQRTLARLKELHSKGAVSIEDFNHAESEFDLRRAQLETKQAQMREVDLRLKQAKRRLQRLTQQPPEDRPRRKRGGDEAGPGAMRPQGAGLPGAPGGPGAGGGPPGGVEGAGGGGIGGVPPGRAGFGAPGGPGRGAVGAGGGGPPGAGGGMKPGSGPGGAMAGAGGGGMMGRMAGIRGGPRMMGQAPEGIVTEVDAKNNLLTISIGSDSGVNVGDTLEVYRTKPEPKYLGTIRILAAQADKAVGRLTAPPRSGLPTEGDIVATQITSSEPGMRGMSGTAGMAGAGRGGRMSAMMGGRMGDSASALASSWASDLFEERAWDFGTVPRGGLLNHSFRLTNDLDQMVQIKDVRVSAGFLTARASGKQLAPGASATINVQMDPTRFSGDKTSSIYVQFDQPWQATVQLQVQADSRDNAMTTMGLKQGETLGRDSQAKIELLERKLDRLMEELAALRKQLSQPGPKE